MKHSKPIAKTPARKNKQQRWALLLLLLGLVAAVAVVYLFFQSGGSDVKSASADAPVGGGTGAEPASSSVSIDGGKIYVASLSGIDNNDASPQVGHTAPNFVFKSAEGDTATLADFRGQPVVVNFWATWCPPCRAEMPDLVQAYEKYQDDGLIIIEVDSAEPPEAVSAFMNAFGMTMPVVIDPRNEVMATYKAQGLPASFFLDRDGVIQTRWIGMLTGDKLETFLQDIL